jgi:hypothetical protein
MGFPRQRKGEEKMRLQELREKKDSGQEFSLLESIEYLCLEMKNTGEKMKEATELLNQKGGWVYRI